MQNITNESPRSDASRFEETDSEFITASHQDRHQVTGTRDEQQSRSGTSKKRKRRILSCDTCRRLKCRCEFEPGQEVCSRCRTLRIACSKSDEVEFGWSQQEPAKGLGVEERLGNLERSITEIRALLQISSVVRQATTEDSTPSQTAPQIVDNTGTNVVSNDFEPADLDVIISPAEVVRKVGKQLYGGYRRTLDYQEDLVSLGMLSEEMAQDLITKFIRHRRNFLLVNHEKDLSMSNDVRQDSPFLHAVCCLHGIRNSSQPCDTGSETHRRVYEHVRKMLGQVMVVSPLRPEELTGILIMAAFAASPTQAPEYIDSWLLSGHCAQQAMLSISFSEIMARTKDGDGTLADQSAMRLWANTCLVNLHWAAAAGRPPTIPNGYLRQCSILLSFGQATMQDGMLHAEILLYCTLYEKFAQRSYLGDDGVCEEFSAWRQRWAYLFALPTSPTLRISFHIAWLILARRSLEHWSERQQDGAATDSSHGDAMSSDQPSSRAMQTLIHNFAIQVVKIFQEMPIAWAEDLPEFHLLCVAYALLTLSKYKETTQTASDEDLLQILRSIQERSSQSKTIPIALRFALERALEQVAGRLNVACVRDPADLPSEFTSEAVGVPYDSMQGPSESWAQEPQVTATDYQSVPLTNVSNPLYDMLDSTRFFFSGGYLSLIDNSWDTTAQ